MKNKAPLSLIEEMIMTLVLALAAAICLMVFAFSDNVSNESKERDEAVFKVQNAAECLISGNGDLIEQDVNIEYEDTGSPYLIRARISAPYGKDGKEFSVTASWQEEKP